SGRNPRGFHGLQGVGARTARAPRGEALADDVRMLAAAAIVAEALVVEPLLGTQHPAELLPERLADDLDDEPAAVRALEEVRRRRAVSEVALRHAIGPGDRLLDQDRVRDGERRRHQRAVDFLAAAAALARHEREQRAEGGADRGAEVDPVDAGTARRI